MPTVLLACLAWWATTPEVPAPSPAEAPVARPAPRPRAPLVPLDDPPPPAPAEPARVQVRDDSLFCPGEVEHVTGEVEIDYFGDPYVIELPTRIVEGGYEFDLSRVGEDMAAMKGPAEALRLKLLRESIVVRARLDGGGYVEIGGRCPTERPPPAWVVGTAQHLGPEGRLFVCSKPVQPGPGGRFREVAEAGAPCRVWAERTDGLADVYSDEVVVMPIAGEEVTANVALPAERQGFTGFRLMYSGRGVTLRSVSSFRRVETYVPLWFVGGEVIEVDGIDVRGMNARQVGHLMNRPVGGSATITIDPGDPATRFGGDGTYMYTVLGERRIVRLPLEYHDSGTDQDRVQVSNLDVLTHERTREYLDALLGPAE